MADRLVTVATFDLSPQAQAAKNALEAEGIRAVLADETTVGMVWELANALGGVKVQVREEEAKRADQILSQHFGEGEEDLDLEELAKEAEAAVDTDVEPIEESLKTEPDEPATPTGMREDDSRRLFFVGWLGILFPPASFYALYLLLNAAFGSGPLSSRGRFNLLVGGGLTIVGLGMMLVFIFLYGVDASVRITVPDYSSE